jgi:hypothetical protein
MLVSELKKILKSRKFKSSIKDTDEHYIFTFSEIYIYRDGQYISEYEIAKDGDDFIITFQKSVKEICTSNFKNILLISNGITQVLNFDGLDLSKKGKYDLTLVGQ